MNSGVFISDFCDKIGEFFRVVILQKLWYNKFRRCEYDMPNAEINNNNLEYKPGDHVVYKHNGICTITDIKTQDFAGEKRLYYILTPVYSPSEVIYVPADNKLLTAHLCRILTKDEINTIIFQTEEIEDEWIDSAKDRTEYFQNIIDNGDRSQILWIVKSLTLHKINMMDTKKKFYVCDERILEAAERIITDEFAFVLGIDKEKVLDYITLQLSEGNLT